jgi:hypothetical protein
VNKRAITWLLATLLAISASAAVPVTRASAGSADSTIVWIAQHRAEQRVLAQAYRPEANARPAVWLNYEPPSKVRLFFSSLFQRPPPFLR